ncbi:hypothetical protein C8J56DRAFT_783497 [Mycena floridula]|nr:hypothetical protein C8J56DRAFT_783497 [Mycena floridula]
MRSSTFSTVFIAVLLAALNVNADIVGFSGDACNGDKGGNVACDGSCHSFTGRHSFKANGKHCVTMFEGASCAGEHFFFNGEGAGKCINVNTGTAIKSFRCARSTTCHS